MATEIERKFLVNQDKLPPLPIGKKMSQGYIPTQNGTTVRVRIQDQEAFLTLKGVAAGISRSEFEYSIPLAEAESMLAEFCQGGCVEKIRYEIDHEGLVWELDIFSGMNQELIVAEIELTSEDQTFNKPDWVTIEVSDQKKYSNFALLLSPYSTWD